MEIRKQLAPTQTTPKASRNKVLFWRDVCVIVDDGTARAADYADFGKLILEQKSRFAKGIGCLVIIPEHSKPPPDEVRKAINCALADLESGLRCFCWIVESSGFHAAIARGVLTGIRILARHKYPIETKTNIEDALNWMLPQLEGGKQRLGDIPSAVSYVRQQRGLARL